MKLTRGLFILFTVCIVTIEGETTGALDELNLTDDEIKCGSEIKETCLPKVTENGKNDRSLCADLFALYKCYDDQFQNTASCNDDMSKRLWEKELRFLINKDSYKTHCQAAIWFVEERIRIADSPNCKWLLSLYKRFDEQSQNGTNCDTAIRKHFWEKEKLFLSETDRQCQNVIEFIDEKIENADPECKSTNSLNCTMLLSLYQRYDEQYQNDTNCDTEKRKNFWEKEKLFLSESDRQCQNVIQFIDEKIENVDPECKSTNSLNCTMLLSLYKRYDEQYQNDTNCDTEKRKYFWEKEKLFLSESDRQCQNVIQFIDEKIENVDQECNLTESLNCTTLLSLYKRYDEQSQNGATCDTMMGENFWEKEKLFLNESDLQCQNVIQFIDEQVEKADQKCNSTESLNCTMLLSIYKSYDEQSQNDTNCDTESHFWAKYLWSKERLFLSETDRQCQNVIEFIDEKIENADQKCNSTESLNCTWLLSFYDRYDEQFQNGTNYDTKLQRKFWENEKLFLNESSQCQSAIPFIDDRLSNIKDSVKPNGADAFGIQSTVIGVMVIISVFLKNMAVFDRLT